jgi:hypothetical protein
MNTPRLAGAAFSLSGIHDNSLSPQAIDLGKQGVGTGPVAWI